MVRWRCYMWNIDYCESYIAWHRKARNGKPETEGKVGFGRKENLSFWKETSFLTFWLKNMWYLSLSHVRPPGRNIALTVLVNDQISNIPKNDSEIKVFKIKQALRSKFLVTAKGWYWQTSLEICYQLLSYDYGCYPVHWTCVLLYYAVKLYFLVRGTSSKYQLHFWVLLLVHIMIRMLHKESWSAHISFWLEVYSSN